jgi:hypothetical protein
MNKTAILSTTALTVASVGAIAGPQSALAADAGAALLALGPAALVSGYVEAHFGLGQWRKYDDASEYDSESFTQIGGAGRLNWWMSPGMSLQADAYGTGFSNKDTTFGAAVHLAWRNPNQGAIGFMGSIGNRTVPECCDNDNRYTAAAIQGQLYLGNITLYGQLGGVHKQDSTGNAAVYAMLQGRFFLNPDTVIRGDIMTATTWDDNSLFRAGIEIEHKPMGMPLSIYARAQTLTLDEGGCCWSHRSHEIKIGAKLFVNEPTLLYGDRRGATFFDANPIFGDKASKVWED